MSELSRAQTKFSEVLLKSRGGDGKVEAGLLQATLKQELGLEVGGGEIEELVQLLGGGSEFEVWAQGHLFQLQRQHRLSVLLKIQQQLGLSEALQAEAAKFADRNLRIAQKAFATNSKLYVDAEQSYIQPIIDSLAMQLSVLFNTHSRVTIMNGFQAYRTRTPALLQREIQRCRMLGINFGIKLVRGAYMNEERKLAQEHNYTSPIWSSIEQTH